MTLSLGGALEELLPKFIGVGFPALFAASAYFAAKRPPVEGLLFALIAGAAEDSLSSLPFATSMSFFAAAAVLVQRLRLPPALAPFLYGAYQLWLWVWLGSTMDGSVFSRAVAALPAGAAATFAAFWILSWADRKGAVDEAEG
jgi:hypothetical protein